MIPQRWSKYTFKEGSNLPLLAQGHGAMASVWPQGNVPPAPQILVGAV